MIEANSERKQYAGHMTKLYLEPSLLHCFTVVVLRRILGASDQVICVGSKQTQLAPPLTNQSVWHDNVIRFKNEVQASTRLCLYGGETPKI